MDWRELDVATREARMNPRAALGNAVAEAYLEGYDRRARAARSRLDGTYDIRFGLGTKAGFDLFRPPTPGPHPVFVFIHGGYWRALDKAQHSFVVEPAVEAGFAGLVVTYDLCPAVTLDDIVAQMRAFMGFLGREARALGVGADQIAVAGHSAGAHLAAMLMHDAGDPAAPKIGWACLASGIYEPEAILEISINQEVRLTPEMAARNDALVRPPQGRPEIVVTVGGDEPAAWIAQSEAYARMARAAGHDVEIEVVAGADHFSLLDTPIVPPLKGRV